MNDDEVENYSHSCAFITAGHIRTLDNVYQSKPSNRTHTCVFALVPFPILSFIFIDSVYLFSNAKLIIITFMIVSNLMDNDNAYTQNQSNFNSNVAIYFCVN